MEGCGNLERVLKGNLFYGLLSIDSSDEKNTKMFVLLVTKVVICLGSWCFSSFNIFLVNY